MNTTVIPGCIIRLKSKYWEPRYADSYGLEKDTLLTVCRVHDIYVLTSFVCKGFPEGLPLSHSVYEIVSWPYIWPYIENRSYEEAIAAQDVMDALDAVENVNDAD